MSAMVGDVSWPPLPVYARRGGTPLDGDEAAERVLKGALRWIEEQLEWFAPGRWEEFLPRRPFRPGPLLELLGLIRVLDQAGIVPKDAPLSSHALDLAVHVASEADFERGLGRGDEFFPYHLNLIALLGLLGRPQPALRAMCEALLAAGVGAHAQPYKPVFTRIELRYFIDRGGFAVPATLPDIGSLHRQSIAALHPNVLHLTESETYALTHVLFYVTDFGRRRRFLGGSAEVARLHETVRVLLGVHFARGSLDLLAELLLCDSALAHEGDFDPLVCEGWNALARAQRLDGAVPSPLHRPEILANLAGDKATAYLFGTCYHTTMVAALAATVRKRGAGNVRTSEGDQRFTPQGFPLPCADPDEIRLWVRKASGTVPVSVPMEWSAYLDSLLVLSVQARDPAVLAEVVRVADRLGHGERPLVRSAAALLAVWARCP